MYSQNNEENLILGYFKNHTGAVLDIGANDGKTLSNSLRVIELGWNGVMVEPSKESFYKLSQLHKANPKVVCLNYAIADREGELEFHESGTHLKRGDHSLLSSLKLSETVKWRHNTTFEKTTVKAITFGKLLELSPYKTFDLITIDVEGVDYEVLTQIDLKKVECKMLIVETNSIEDQKYIDYCRKLGMKVYAKNYMNLIFVRD